MRGVLLFITILINYYSDAQTISTVAGGGSSTVDSVPATTESIGYFAGLVVDSSGNLYIADGNHNKIQKVDYATGIITTIAGTGTAGFSGDSGLATFALLNDPTWVTIDNHGDLIITDGENYRIRKIETATGIITTIAGNGAYVFNGDSISALTAAIGPQKAVTDRYGNLYIADDANQRIRKVDTSGIITTIAGKGIIGYSGDGGLADSAEIESCYGLCVDTSENVYIADWTNNRIRKVDQTTGIITTIAGDGSSTYSGDSIAAISSQVAPFDVTIDITGNIYIADYHNSRVRLINAFSDTIFTIAGNGTYGFSGDGSFATLAQLNRPEGVVLDVCGNLYIADYGNNRVRKVVMPPAPVTFTSAITASPGDTVCLGTSVTYTATITGTTGTSYSYQWYHNGAPVGTASTFTCIPDNNDSIRCMVIASNTCGGTGIANNTVTMTVDTFTTPTISISGITSAMVSSTVSLTATVSNAGSSYTIKWYDNGTLFATTTSLTTSYIKTGDTDSITALIIPTGSCYDSATSAAHVVTVNDDAVPGIPSQPITIYPNPAHNQITITGSNIINITITNTIGQTILTQNNKGTINIAALPSGIYFVKVTDSEGRKTINKIVKQ